MSRRFICRSLQETEAVAATLAAELNGIDAFMVWLQGDMGVGKTTLIRAILKNFGVEDVVSSPTFTYLNEYTNYDGELFAHIDLYRLEHQNADDILAHLEYGRHRGVFVEWPALGKPPRADLLIQLSYLDEISRIISVGTLC